MYKVKKTGNRLYRVTFPYRFAGSLTSRQVTVRMRVNDDLTCDYTTVDPANQGWDTSPRVVELVGATARALHQLANG